LGPFAIDAAVGYRRGSMRGERGQLSSNFIQREELLAQLGQSINDLILSHREQFESIDLRQRVGWSGPAFPVTRSPDEPKRRWVDGTPENSFYICGLRKLFPKAVFVHLVRDVTDMVRSLLNFYPEGRDRLVANEQAAYEYWLRRTTCCIEAEEAYGPRVVHRMRYSDIVRQPESAMRSLLDFLGERYTSQCLEPLATRINSSNVPADFNPSDPATDPALVEQARQLSDRLQSSPQPGEALAQVAEKLETEFNQRIEYLYDLSAKYSEAQQLIAKLQKECELLKRNQCSTESFGMTLP
jgi:hypothetical protein